MSVFGILSIWGESTLETLCLHLETYFLHMNETGGKKFLSNPKTIPLVWKGLGKGLRALLGGLSGL